MLASLLLAFSGTASAGIADTKHNLGNTSTQTNHVTGTGNSATTTNEICVFCHTPHGADVATTNAPPLWNKRLATGASYTTYATLNTPSLDGEVLPVGSISVACLSCHDGTQAMDNIINAPGSGGYDATGGGAAGRAYTWTAAGTDGVMAAGIANLTADLSNDHPIGIQYCGGGLTGTGTTVSGTCKDGDFVGATGQPANVKTATINTNQVFWVETGTTDSAKTRTDLPLYTRTFASGSGPSVECGSCHDPHVSEGQAGPNGQTAGATFLRISNSASAVCTTCHVKLARHPVLAPGARQAGLLAPFFLPGPPARPDECRECCMRFDRHGRLVAALLAIVGTCGAALAADASPPTAKPAAPFATVGDTVISAADYQRALAVAIRKKYYHAKPPEAELAQFQREVGDDVVNRVLLLGEARRRGIQPDREKVNATVAGYDAQYKGSANWAANREKMLAAVVPQLERESLLDRLERLVKNVPAPSEAAARSHYDEHKDLFVEPEQIKLSVIVLKVDPSSPQAAWNSAHAEARTLHRKLLGGADFAELARLHSADRTATRGGEMDYTHRGMLPEALHGVIDKLQARQLAEPVQLLEGVAIVRLEDRKPAQQRGFEQVRERAAELWQRAEGETRWKKLIATLRQGTVIHVDESHYGPQRSASEKPRAG